MEATAPIPWASQAARLVQLCDANSPSGTFASAAQGRACRLCRPVRRRIKCHCWTTRPAQSCLFLASSEQHWRLSSNTSSSVDGGDLLFSGTGGKTGKRATGSGIAADSGVLGTATSGTDYALATSGSAILKGNGSGGFSSATAGTDHAIPAVRMLRIADGGTGANTAAGARTNLGSTTVGDAVLLQPSPQPRELQLAFSVLFRHKKLPMP